ncbi:hypothetical protein FF041_24155 [Streptomyces jumonjinensis]|uniref:Uncharacterized protein n=1 Tax=Streptomyces jumonjinensis TaxID=1945 RepID=A0A646KLH5_STRJU|nr:hypothetical protein [Streptomyces jumonjinensis]
MRRWQAWKLRLAGAAGWAVGAFGRALPGLASLAGLGLVSYGAWLAWRPAGFLTAGVLLLADQIAGRVAASGVKG